MMALDSFIGECQTAKDIADARRDATGGAARGARLPRQSDRAGGRHQDRIQFDPLKQEARACPTCGHFMVMAVNEDETRAFNAAVDQDYQDAVIAYNQNPRANKKPQRAKKKGILLACYCVKNNCMGRDDGGNCFNCKSMATTDPDSHRVAGEPNGCTLCHVCPCKCQQLVYYRKQAHKLAAKALEKRGASNPRANQCSPADC